MNPLFFTQRLLLRLRRKQPYQTLFFAGFFLLFTTLSATAQDVLYGLTSTGGVEGKGTIYSIKSDGKNFNVVKGFSDWGSFPVNDLVEGPDGYFYGMTPEGGTYNHGTLFRISSSGEMLILKHFNMPIDGGYPKGSLIVGKDGALYGTTANGGPNSGGVIFKITTAGQYTILRSLSANADGAHPNCRLVWATDGYLYGMNYNGGANYNGTIFKMLPSGSSYTVLHAFKAGTTDGGSPYGSLVQAKDSAFYGMTYLGGTNNRGVIFRITSKGTFTILRNLNGTTDGQYPFGDLIQAKDGYLYGMTKEGGVNYGGTIFKMNTSGTSFTVIKALASATNGSAPHGSLIQAKDGYLYGMTNYSPPTSPATAGEVFKINTSGTMTIIKKFTLATEGGYPQGGLVQGSDGLLYGMTYQGGKNDNGTIFKVTTGGTITVLSHFNNDVAGTNPMDNLALGKDSAYFGVTQNGGLYNAGTIYKMCGGVTTVMRSLTRNTDGANPVGGLVKGNDGNLYGTTSYGGANSSGTIFKITPSGSFSVLKHLKTATDGGVPEAALVVGPDGALYGTTTSGGTGGGGTAFRITTGGSFSVIHHFVLDTEGGNMQAALVLGKDGFFYGVTGSSYSRFFKMAKEGAVTVLHKFVYNTEGNLSDGALVQGTDGAFYGTTVNGGTYGHGTIFRITTAGSISILRHLNGPSDGKTAKAGLVQGSDGAFYGTTSLGGKYNAGTIFRITTSKTFTVLRHLNIATDGGTPLGGLVVSPKIVLVANAQAVTTAEDVAKAITLTGSGATNLTFNIVTKPRNGAISGTGAARTYTPRANFYGVDSFAFTTSVGCLASAPAWVKVTVTSVNDAPVLSSIGNKTVVKGTALKFTATATDADAGQTKTFSLISAPSGATIGATTGAFAWTPTATGTFTFKVRVTDNGSPVLYDEESITVTVTASLLNNTMQPTITTSTAPIHADIAQATLFPNPVTTRLTITLGGSTRDVNISIVNVKGATVYSQQYNGPVQQIHVDAASLQPGAYLVLLQTADDTQTLKFVKQ